MPEPRTGRGVRIAVIDSGVHARHPHVGRIAGGVGIDAEGGLHHGEAAWTDRLGHGTAVIAAIQEKAPDAELHAVRVFHDALRTRASTLIRAIRWCAAERMDVVNLSLGTVNAAHGDAFAAAVAEARATGCLLVAAWAADGVACYPGSLPGVFGVALDEDCPRDAYRVGVGGAAFAASGHPRPVRGVPQAHNLQGISFAVANMTGFVARACEAVDGAADRVEAVHAWLAAEARAVAEPEG